MTEDLKIYMSFGLPPTHISTDLCAYAELTSILSFTRHDYFRRLLCSWVDAQNNEAFWGLSFNIQKDIIEKVCYKNVKDKIIKGSKK